MKKILISWLLFAILLTIAPILMASERQIPIPGEITMLDLGADKCLPCKMMAPILVKLTDQYQDKANIMFIDVWRNPDQAKRFKISAIPTQIFFDKTGKEVYRHQGFMAEEDIINQLSKMGVSKPVVSQQ